MVAINTSKKMESLKAEIELSIAGSQGTLEGIIRCVERLRQLSGICGDVYLAGNLL